VGARAITTAKFQTRLAIRAQFRQTTNVFDRWLAAPRISRGITNASSPSRPMPTGTKPTPLWKAGTTPPASIRTQEQRENR